MKTKYNYSDYMRNSKALFKQIFGDKLYKTLDKIPLKPIDWGGIDITCTDITVVCNNIKERFSESEIQRHNQNGTTALDLFLGAVFHYGYQQSSEHNSGNFDALKNMMNSFIKNEYEKDDNS